MLAATPRCRLFYFIFIANDLPSEEQGEREDQWSLQIFLLGRPNAAGTLVSGIAAGWRMGGLFSHIKKGAEKRVAREIGIPRIEMSQALVSHPRLRTMRGMTLLTALKKIQLKGRIRYVPAAS